MEEKQSETNILLRSAISMISPFLGTMFRMYTRTLIEGKNYQLASRTGPEIKSSSSTPKR